ncbi:hypothetical protein, partial [Escherichia coli]|uniref:hypothetical protein n=1 Tax=Escherichia coli TaxID=562 RepID=UPI0013B0054E
QAKVVGVLIHGDSALGGLGVNQTTFNLSQTQGYGTGGTLHLVLTAHMANVRRVFNELIGDDESETQEESLSEQWRELWQDALQ